MIAITWWLADWRARGDHQWRTTVSPRLGTMPVLHVGRGRVLSRQGGGMLLLPRHDSLTDALIARNVLLLIDQPQRDSLGCAPRRPAVSSRRPRGPPHLPRRRAGRAGRGHARSRHPPCAGTSHVYPFSVMGSNCRYRRSSLTPPPLFPPGRTVVVFSASSMRNLRTCALFWTRAGWSFPAPRPSWPRQTLI